MRNIKLAGIVSVVGILAACGGKDGRTQPPPPVTRIDGPYVVTLENPTITCTDAAGNPTTNLSVDSHTVQIDVVERSDGLYDLRLGDKDTPVLRYGTVVGTSINGGVIDYSNSEDDFTGLVTTVKGTVTREELSLSLSETFPVGTEQCTYIGTVAGKRRDIANPEAVDGFYAAVVDVGSYGCPAPAGVSQTYNVPLDVSANPAGGIDVAVNGDDLTFTTTKPGTDGVVNYTGVLDDSGAPHGATFTGTVSGTVTADAVNLDVVHSFVGDTPNCGVHSVINGKRFVPEVDTIVNDYSMDLAFVASPECGSPSEEFVGFNSIRWTSDSTYVLAGDYARDLPPIDVAHDGTFASTVATDAVDGFDLSLVGNVDYPTLSYTLTYRSVSPRFGTCDITVTGVGLVRYIQ